MAENSVNLKIFLRDESISEARRVSVDASVATSYMFIKEKLETVFPNLRNAQFKITWRDADGDEITIASDEDLITAFTEMPSNIKILTIKVTQRCPEPVGFSCPVMEEPHRPVIICDGCDKTIVGFRYKCLQCPDFDLCADCEFQGSHSHHVMVRLPNNESYSPRCARKFMHHIARNFKKSAYLASKDACRAAKHAGKYTEKCQQSQNPSTSAEQPENNHGQPSQSCPFNFTDVHAFGTLARENLTQLLEAVPKPNQTQIDSEKKEQGSILFDALMKAVDTFFGHTPETQSTPTASAEPEKKDTPAPMETDVTPSAPTSTNQNSGAASIESNSKVPTPQNETVAEPNHQPAWTFVASNQPQQPANVERNTTGLYPDVACIYHENPVIAEGLLKLHEMGFSNESGVLSNLLEHFNGNVSDVIKAMFDRKM